MIDLEVDDDEWQLAAWFFQDQEKTVPLSALDYHQDLFAVTGTFRAQETEDDGYAVFPRDHFYRMFGEFPETFDKDNDMDELVVCPYEYDSVNMEYTNTITGGHPLVFHFAGNDWLCACTIFATEEFENVTPKFRQNCEERYSNWFDRVEDGILDVAESEDDGEILYLLKVAELENDDATEVGRRLGSSLRELDSSPYKKKRIPRELSSRELDSSPYKKKRFPRELDSSPYKKKRIPRGLSSRELDSSPYKKKRIPRELDSSPYKKKRFPRELDSSPYN